MDDQIVFMALVSFMIFIVAFILVLRVTKPDAALSWLLKTAMVIGIGEGWYVSRYFTMVGLLFWFGLYILFVFMFLFYIFGVIEGSITIRILAEIVKSGSSGLSRITLKHRYGRNQIVTKRLDRFVQSGELKFKNGLYIRGKPSYYTWREYVSAFIYRMFPKT